MAARSVGGGCVSVSLQRAWTDSVGVEGQGGGWWRHPTDAARLARAHVLSPFAAQKRQEQT